MSRARKFLALPPGDRLALLRAAVLLAVARALLAAPGVPVRRVAGTVGSLARTLPGGRRTPPERLAWALDVAGATLPGTTSCLPRAFVGRALLTRAGHEATLRVGVTREGDGLAAHAWVERGGAVVVGDLPDLDRFVPLPLAEMDL